MQILSKASKPFMQLSTLELWVDSVILDRALGYQSKVQDLEQTEAEFWQASVSGTYLYDVEIQLSGDQVSGWLCSCPYDGDMCKHVLATLLNIRQLQLTNSVIEGTVSQTTTSQEKVKKPNKTQQLDELLASLSHEQLSHYIRTLLNKNRNLLNQFLLRYPKVNKIDDKKIVEHYSKLFNKIFASYADHDFIDYYAADNFFKDIEELFDNVNQSTMEVNTQLVVYLELSKYLLNSIEKVDDSNGQVSELAKKLTDFVTHLGSKLQNNDVDLFNKLLKTQFDEDYMNYSFNEIFRPLLRQWSTKQLALRPLYLQASDKAFKGRYETWQIKIVILDKFNFLLAWGEHNSAEQFAKDYLYIDEIREYFVCNAILQKKFTKAKELLNAALEKTKFNNNESLWRNYLMDIAYLEKDVPAIRTGLVYKITHEYEIASYYQKLKETYPADEWQAAYAKLMQVLISHDERRAIILNIEAQWAELYKLIQTALQQNAMQGEALFKRYLPMLDKHYPDKVVTQYADLISKLLATKAERRVYEKVAAELRVLGLLTYGKAMQQQLLTQFRFQYKNRPALLQVLKQIKL
jgi:hypothetical protein